MVGRLGAGGMGQVFLGRSAGGRLVAVTVIRPELAGDPGFRARFAREVAAAGMSRSDSAYTLKQAGFTNIPYVYQCYGPSRPASWCPPWSTCS